MENIVPVPTVAASLSVFKQQAKVMVDAVYAFEDANPKIMFRVHASMPRFIFWNSLRWEEEDGKLIMEFSFGFDDGVHASSIEFSSDWADRRIENYKKQYDDAMARINAHSV